MGEQQALLDTSLYGEVYGLTTFPTDNLSDDLGSVFSPAAIMSVCSEGKAEQPAAYRFGSSVVRLYQHLTLVSHHDVYQLFNSFNHIIHNLVP